MNAELYAHTVFQRVVRGQQGCHSRNPAIRPKRHADKHSSHAPYSVPVPQCSSQLSAHSKVTHFYGTIPTHKDVGRLDVPTEIQIGVWSRVVVVVVAPAEQKRSTNSVRFDQFAQHSRRHVVMRGCTSSLTLSPSHIL